MYTDNGPSTERCINEGLIAQNANAKLFKHTVMEVTKW